MRILSYESIFPLGDFSCHASHFVLLNGGDIFAVWFQGTAEGADDVCIYGAKRHNGKWDKPKRLTADDGRPNWNPVLFRRDDGSVALIYKAGKTIADWKSEIMVSTDNCESFGAPRELVEGDTSGGRGPVRNKIITLSDGSLLAPGSTERGEWKCFFDRSTDGGETWKRSADLRIPSEYLMNYNDVSGHGIIQPTLWEDVDGDVHAFMRSSEGVMFRTDSTDGGVTFYDPYPTALPNNNSGIDVTRVGGSLYLACNPVGNRTGTNWGRRTPLSLMRSDDNGKSFNTVTELATGEGVFAYPALRYDGSFHITFTWNRKLIMYVNIEL